MVESVNEGQGSCLESRGNCMMPHANSEQGHQCLAAARLLASQSESSSLMPLCCYRGPCQSQGQRQYKSVVVHVFVPLALL